MGTTDGVLAATALDALLEVGVPFVLLHNEKGILAASTLSDVDVAVGCDPRAAVEAILSPMRERGLLLVLTWLYDVGSMSSFWMNPESLAGVQVDMTHDPRGSGRYGLLTERVVETGERGKRWPVANPDAELAYLLSKRASKGQALRLAALTESPRASSAAWRQYLTRRRSAALAASLPPDPPNPSSTRRGWRDLFRLAHRAMVPCGHVVHVEWQGPQDPLRQVTNAMSEVLPHARAIRARRLGCWVRSVVYRRRPSLTICWVPDGAATVHSSAESLGPYLVRTMSHKATRGFAPPDLGTKA